jgi:3'-phosphoadenosine 5'-phosphosulfate sulfotransferase (PAPS reductase)/FAD synthetase
MTHIVSFSTGLSSAITAERVQQRFGQVEIIFMDTTIEDADNYRFLNDCRRRWLDLYGNDITVLREGRDPYQVAKDEQIIPNSHIAPCTFKLKIELFRRWLAGQAGTIYIGYDFTEMHRCAPTQASYESLGFQVDFPLLWKPYEFRPYPQAVREDWNIEPPRMYALGYTHANCGGVCVKQGQGDWLRTFINFPERYTQAEAWEQEMRQAPARADYAILKQQTGGKIQALTLRELRERHQGKTINQDTLYRLDYHSSCVVCGVGA